MQLTLTNRDFLVGRVVTPAWYQYLIEDVEEGLSKDGGSTNWVLKTSVIADADTGNTEFAGVPGPRLAFNSKAGGFVIPLFKSLGVILKPGDTINWDALKGQKPVIYTQNDDYEGRPVNSFGKVPKYRMADGSAVV